MIPATIIASIIALGLAVIAAEMWVRSTSAEDLVRFFNDGDLAADLERSYARRKRDRLAGYARPYKRSK